MLRLLLLLLAAITGDRRHDDPRTRIGQAATHKHIVNQSSSSSSSLIISISPLMANTHTPGHEQSRARPPALQKTLQRIHRTAAAADGGDGAQYLCGRSPRLASPAWGLPAWPAAAATASTCCQRPSGAKRRLTTRALCRSLLLVATRHTLRASGDFVRSLARLVERVVVITTGQPGSDFNC